MRLAVLLLLVGCGSGEAPGEFCDAYCSKARACGTGFETCRDSCANSKQPARVDVLAGIAACLPGKGCDAFVSGDYWGECLDEVLPTIAPSAAAEAYCTASPPRLFECGDSSSHARCLSSAKAFKDRYLTAARACFPKETCDALNTCLQKAFRG